MGLYWERAEDERVLDSPFQQQHLLILTAMAAELQTRGLEIQFSGGLNLCFWHSQKCTSISMLINPLEHTDHLLLHLYCLGRMARKAETHLKHLNWTAHWCGNNKIIHDYFHVTALTKDIWNLHSLFPLKWGGFKAAHSILALVEDKDSIVGLALLCMTESCICLAGEWTNKHDS